MPRLSTELLHIQNKSRAWEKTDTLAQKLEKKRLARLRSVKSALKQKKVTRQSAAKLRHINSRTKYGHSSHHSHNKRSNINNNRPTIFNTHLRLISWHASNAIRNNIKKISIRYSQKSRVR